MMTRFVSRINRRIPKKWWFLLGILITIFVLYKHTENTVSSESESRLDPVNDEVRKQHERTEAENNLDLNKQLSEKVRVTANQDNLKVHPQQVNQNQMQVKPPEKELEELPRDVKIPHLFFNEEGMGQMGTGVSINQEKLNKHDKNMFDQGYQRNDFNEYVSNLISVDRVIPETRDPECLNKVYPKDLPDTSVIICFRNEAWSVLVRTVHSVINTSPPHLLKEVILVDDDSDYDHLKAPLEYYMKKFPMVKIVRNGEREGLIRSRLNGARVAIGQVLTFLDSHIECATDWLPPLLARIKENSTNVVWPHIPPIDRHTFKFPIHKTAKDMQIGVFNWQLNYGWEIARVEDRETVTSPIKSPTMAGGLFSIDREYFFYIGSYDEEMRFWGAENLEMSFRIWMCGGTIEIIPCSIIGHVFRRKNPNTGGNFGAIRINTLRTAMVWLDEFKYMYAKATGTKLENYGDISSRLALRQRLKCKSFNWYLTNVYKTVFRPDNARRRGLIHSVHDSSKCMYAVDSMESHVKVKECNKNEIINQIFYLTDYEEIRLLGHCLDAGKQSLIVYICHRMKGTQQFIYRQDNTIFHPTSKKCVQWIEQTSDLALYPCDRNPRQMWVWENISLDITP